MQNIDTLLSVDDLVDILDEAIWLLITDKLNLTRSVEYFAPAALNLELFKVLLRLLDDNGSETAPLRREIIDDHLAGGMLVRELADDVGVEGLVFEGTG